MKIYIAKILKRTEIKKDILKTYRNGITRMSHSTFAFDEVEAIEYYSTQEKAEQALKVLMKSIEEIDGIKWYRATGTVELLWPKNIQHRTDRKNIGEDREILFMAILEEAEVA